MYDLDAFVNGTDANTDLSERYHELVSQGSDADEVMFALLPAEFIAGLGDVVLNDDADPVFVYERDGKPVAWYDCENCVGHR